LATIYGAYLEPILGQTPSNRAKPESVAIAMANAFTELGKAFGPVEQQFHYIFTPIDLTKWTMGLCRYELDCKAKIWGIKVFKFKPSLSIIFGIGK
jgi:hypothetical protein